MRSLTSEIEELTYIDSTRKKILSWKMGGGGGGGWVGGEIKKIQLLSEKNLLKLKVIRKLIKKNIIVLMEYVYALFVFSFLGVSSWRPKDIRKKFY